MNPNNKSVQEQFAPNNMCFGCGPANEKGLRIRSFIEGEQLIATFRPSAHHEAFPGVLNGGIIGSILDCHCNWAAAMHFMKLQGGETPPCTVTANYTIELKRPCPTDVDLLLRSTVVEQVRSRCVVSGILIANGTEYATCKGTFVAVKPGHPAYHRW
jgi:acyl-coenzyme A thioesterase PaaI-like protein